MRIVYYYNEEGKFSSREVIPHTPVLYITGIAPMSSWSQGYQVEADTTALPITEYKTRYGDTIWIASRSEFEAKCLIKNHLDLDKHIETSYPLHVYENRFNLIQDELLNRLIHKTKSKFRFSLQIH